MNKNGLDFTFSWIFAIIAGAVILFSAIYITTKLIDSSEVQEDTLVAGELSNVLGPVETNLEDSKYSVIKFSRDTRVFNDCSTSGAFGSTSRRPATSPASTAHGTAASWSSASRASAARRTGSAPSARSTSSNAA